MIGDVVLGINLTDAPEGGAEDPLSQVVVDLACSAAKVAASPLELIGAHMALGALETTIRDGLPEFGELIQNVRRLLDEAGAVLAKEANS